MWVPLICAIGARCEEPQSWPCFGGSPSRNFINISTTNLPATWEVRADKSPQNLFWSAKLGTRVFGSPVVAGGKVFIGTNNGVPRNLRDVSAETKKPRDKSVLMCFDAADGRFLWQHVNDKLDDPIAHDWPQYGICSTPYVDGDRLYYVTNRAEVVCLDVEGFANGNQGVQDEPYKDATDADVIWRFDMIKELGVQPHRMSASSPVIAGNLLFVITGNGVDTDKTGVPAPQAPSFIAIDKKSGKLTWKDSSPGRNILHGQWSSPAYGELDGRPQVVFGGGDGWLRGFDPQTGRQLWQFDGNLPGVPVVQKSFFVAMPVIHGRRIYVGTGANPEYSAGPGVFWCLAPGKGHVDVLWRLGDTAGPNSEGRFAFGRTISTCAIHDGLIYAAELNGFLHCLDAASGKSYWEHDLKAAVWGSPLWADGKVHIGTEDGDVWVFAHGKEKKLLAGNEMGSPIYSTPAAVTNVLFIATSDHLFAIRKQ
jgi:outer membrane protein assembly factor BamB